MGEKRRRGDRRDGAWVRDVTGLQAIMMNLMPNRTDCEVCLHDQLDATELVKYLEKKNLQHPDFKTTVFHCFVLSLARMVKERPLMNRFIQGRRMYMRNDITMGFVAKRRFADGAEESLMFMNARDDDVIDTISRRIYGDVREVKSHEHSTGGVDATMDVLKKLPRLLLMLVCRVVRLMDFWGVNPESLTEGDPNYSSIFCSNLGSIKCPSVYHHLNNYGTNSIMITIGMLHKEELIMDDGSKAIRDVLDISATLDERIADGFYFARSLKLVKHIFANPAILDMPLAQPSGFDFD